MKSSSHIAGVCSLTLVFRAIVAIAALLLVPGMQAAAQDAPWTERAIRAHVEQSDLRDELPAIVLEELRRQGEALFTAKFTPADGAGRPLATQAAMPQKRAMPPESLFDRASGPDANSCSGCHNQPAAGGAGGFVANIFVSGTADADLSPMPDPARANERGTTHIFGAGLIELLAREMTGDLLAIRDAAMIKARTTDSNVTVSLAAKAVGFGEITVTPAGNIDTSRVEGVDPDLVIRPFGQKGVFVSLREFTVNVLNHHHGMQAQERFGFAQTGELDFDGDGIATEITEGDVSAIVAWLASLPPPVVKEPEDPAWQEAATRGRQVFDALGCSICHIPALPLDGIMFSDPGPLDAEGTLSVSDVSKPAVYNLALLDWAAKLPRDTKGRILVPLFGDLKRHQIAKPGEQLGNERIPQRGVAPGVFITAELWGLESTSPYGHRGDLVTIDEIIRAHGGEADTARKNYDIAAETDRSALIAYLRTMIIAD